MEGRAMEDKELVTTEACAKRHGALMEKLDSIEKRLFVDNGSLSIQTRLARHEMAIRAILWVATLSGGAGAALLVRAIAAAAGTPDGGMP
jgi:hypothetical protein